MKVILLFVVVGVTGIASAVFGDAIGNVGETKLKGYLGSRLDAMIERHVIGMDIDYLTACFQEKTETKGWWQTEFCGKKQEGDRPSKSGKGTDHLVGRGQFGWACPRLW